jgi:hypothetical protein
MAHRITKANGEKVLAAIKSKFAAYIDPEVEGSGPELVMDFDWVGTPGPAIVWEGGPFEWVYLALWGGVDEELTTDLMTIPEYVTFTKTGKATNPAIVTPIEKPANVYCEAITSWALGLYPA